MAVYQPAKQVTQQKTIGGRRFTVTKLTGTESVLVLNHLLRLVAPSLAKAAGCLNGERPDDLGAVNVAGLGDALATFVERLSDQELLYFKDKLLATATVNDALLEPIFEVELQGEPETIVELLVFALEVNFGGFFERWLKRMLGKLPALSAGRAPAAPASASKSPATSANPGPSGA